MRKSIFILMMLLSPSVTAQDLVWRTGVRTGVVFSETSRMDPDVTAQLPVALSFSSPRATSPTLIPFLAFGFRDIGFVELGATFQSHTFEATTRRKNILGETTDTISETQNVDLIYIPALVRFALISDTSEDFAFLRRIMMSLGGSLHHQTKHDLVFESQQNTLQFDGKGTVIDGISHRTSRATYGRFEAGISAELMFGRFLVPIELRANLSGAPEDNPRLFNNRSIATQDGALDMQIMLLTGIGYEIDF